MLEEATDCMGTWSFFNVLEKIYNSHKGRPRCRVGVNRLEQSASKLEGMMELAFVLAEVQVASSAVADGLGVALVVECL